MFMFGHKGLYLIIITHCLLGFYYINLGQKYGIGAWSSFMSHDSIGIGSFSVMGSSEHSSMVDSILSFPGHGD